MKKIMFDDRFGLTEAVLAGRKTMTRRILKCPKKFKGIEGIDLEFHKRLDQDFYYDCVVVDADGQELGQLPLPYEIGDVVAIAQRYEDAINPLDWANTLIYKDEKGWKNKMFVRADLMPHHIRITDLWFERMQDISDEGCLKEGITKDYFKDFPQQKYFPYKGCKDTEVTWTPQGAFHLLIDKVSHKCVIDAAIKHIKNDPDPYGDADVRHGQISILEELRDLIVRGQNIERERILKRFNKETK